MDMKVTQTINLAPLNLLLVDDNRPMCTILGAVLKGVGIQHVRDARDGAEALEILRQCPVDIAIIDYNMQPPDGVELRVSSGCRKTPPIHTCPSLWFPVTANARASWRPGMPG